MRIERSKNAGRNMIFGTLLKVYQIIVPFFLRTVMLYYLGEKYLGLNSLFSSILQVLNLAELGVGYAMIYSMYTPIAEDDSSTICALMRLYRLYYRCIGGIIAVIGLLITPIIPKLISGDVPADINLYVLYFLNLGATVLSYWLFAYKNALLYAHQRDDVSSKITIITTTFQFSIQLIVLILLRNYYLYILTMLATQAITNVITANIVDKMYPNYKPVGSLPSGKIKEINNRIKDIFTTKIGDVAVNSVDSIVISSFLGLTVLASYQNYFFILKSISGFMLIIFAACTAGIGNSIVVETREKNFTDLNKFTFIIVWISGFCCCCFLTLYQPFMKLWVGEKFMMDYSVVICLTIYFFIYQISRIMNTYKDAAGIWHKDRFRPIVTAIVNLILNIILVQFIGIYGIVLCTIISTLAVGLPWLMYSLFTALFGKFQMIIYIKKIMEYVVVVVISCFITYTICSMIHVADILQIVLNLVICIIIPNLIFLCVFYKKKEFLDTIELIDKMTQEKLHLKSHYKRS